MKKAALTLYVVTVRMPHLPPGNWLFVGSNKPIHLNPVHLGGSQDNADGQKVRASSIAFGIGVGVGATFIPITALEIVALRFDSEASTVSR